MSEYGKNKKRLFTKLTDHLHAKFLVKLQEDKIKQGTFLTEIINSYVNDDPAVRQWIDSNPSFKRTSRSKQFYKAEENRIKKTESNFNLNEKEVDELFDILADEFGD